MSNEYMPAPLQMIVRQLHSILQCGHPDFQKSLVPSHIKYFPPQQHHTCPTHLFHFGGSLATFNDWVSCLERVMKEKPSMNQNFTPDGRELIGCKATFSNGVGVVFLMEKSGLGLHIPEAFFKELRQQLTALPPPQRALG